MTFKNFKHLQIYLVGGAVRDRLLQQPVVEKDWVVVGATPDELLALGFKPVGKDFPVFLHPQTHEEYALARTERKTAPGYKGFTFYAAPDVTLQQDLQRRDLTINAMAMSPAGELIDPYGGKHDLQVRQLRHVSAAFVEDPVRILRVARFMARFSGLGFSVAPETQQLMQQMVCSGEVNALVPDRVWQEFYRALTEPYPLAFFQTLNNCGALVKLFPEYAMHLDNLTFSDVASPLVRFGCLALSLLPSELDMLVKRYPVPKNYQRLAKHVVNLRSLFLASTLSADQLLYIFDFTDSWRKPENLRLLEKVFHGAPLNDVILEIYQQATAIKAREFLTQGLQGKALGEAMAKKRLACIQGLLNR